MTTKRKIIIWGGKLFILLIIGLRVLYSYMKGVALMGTAGGFRSNYMGILIRLVKMLMQQLKGEIPFQTVYGCFHGSVYPIFLAYLGNFLGISSPEIVCSYVQGFMLIAMLMVTPFFVQQLTGKFWLGIMATVSIWYFGKSRLCLLTYAYWGAPVVILMSLPLLCDLFRNIKEGNRKRDCIEILIIVCLMTIGNITRQASAFPILCLLALYLCLKMLFQPKLRKTISCLSGLVIIILVFLYFEPTLYKIYDLCSGPIKMANVERPWHALWCGLGYEENEYGFKWEDAVAVEYAKSVNPDVVANSEEYFDILKVRVLEILREDPSFVFSVWWNKFVDSLKLGWTIYGNRVCKSAIIFGASYLLTFIRNKKRKSMWFLLGLLAGGLTVLLGTVQGVIGMVHEVYIMASLAGWIYLIMIFTIGTLNNLSVVLPIENVIKNIDKRQE